MTDETALYLRVRGEVRRVAGRSAVIGRSASCDVQADEQGVSRRHCEVLLRDDGVTVRDLGSSHGTWVAGRQVAGEVRLGAGVLVNLGSRGPHFEVVNAIVHGRPVLGPSPPSPSNPTSDADPTIDVPPAATPAPPAAPVSRFWTGAAWGALIGVLAGAALAVFTEIPYSG